MKNKYQRLTKAEKKQAVKDFRAASEKNNNYMKTLTRMKVYGILGLIYGIAAILSDVFVLNAAVWAYLVDGVVIVFSLYLLIQRNTIKTAVVNNFLINGTPATEEEAPKKRKHVSKNAKAKKAQTKAVNKVEEIKVEVKEEPKKEEPKKAPAKKAPTKKAPAKKAAPKKNTAKKAPAKKATKKAK